MPFGRRLIINVVRWSATKLKRHIAVSVQRRDCDNEAERMGAIRNTDHSEGVRKSTEPEEEEKNHRNRRQGEAALIECLTTPGGSSEATGDKSDDGLCGVLSEHPKS